MNPHKDCLMCNGTGKYKFTITTLFADKPEDMGKKEAIEIDCYCKSQYIQTSLLDYGFPEKP